MGSMAPFLAVCPFYKCLKHGTAAVAILTEIYSRIIIQYIYIYIYIYLETRQSIMNVKERLFPEPLTREVKMGKKYNELLNLKKKYFNV